MNPRLRFCWIVLSFALVLSCSSGEKGSQNPATGGATANGGSGGVGGAGTGGSGLFSTGGGAPVITMAPPTWAPPADCKGVGEKCEVLSCGGTALCQLEGNVCIPPIQPGMLLPGQSVEHPYCLAYTCMTYEEASCFCTGEAAKQYSTCKTGPAAVAGLCNGEGAACGTAPGTKACCDGLTCSMTSPTSGSCRKTCTTGTECDTGCCADVQDNGQLVCAPETACTNPCKKRGEACEANTTGNCCNGTCVTSDNPEFAGCRALCKVNEDCDTGCCQLFQGSTTGFCAAKLACTGCKADSECSTQCCIKPSDLDHAICVDPKFCACAPEGGECAGDTGISRCCGGGVCSRPSTSTGPYTCSKSCKLDTDCPGGCCGAFFQGMDYGVCHTGPDCG